MKKFKKHLFSLILAVMMMNVLALTGFAAGVVTFEANGQKFDFAPGTEYSPSDLFTDFKELMPGDCITQTVRVVNNGKSGCTTKIYIKALGPSDISEITSADKTVNQKVLEQLELDVVAVKNKKSLFDAAAEETDGLADWVLLGSLRKGGEVELEVTVTVPLTMGNEFQNVAAGIDWVFKAEEIPDTSKPYETGDNTDVLLYGSVFGMATMALIAIIVLKKRTREK